MKKKFLLLIIVMLTFVTDLYALEYVLGDSFQATVGDVKNVYFRVTSISPIRTVGIGSGGTAAEATTNLSGRFVIPETVTDPQGRTYYVTSISDYAFHQSVSLEQIVIPNTVETIGERAFENCSKLEQVSGGDSVKELKTYAFASCRRLMMLNWCFPVLERIGTGAFGDCKSLYVQIPSTVKEIGPYAFQNTKISIAKIPSGIETIEKGTFFGCSNLEFLTLPESLKKIDEKAFAKTGLKEINLPGNIKFIESQAFSEVAVTKVTINNAVPPSLVSDAFDSYTVELMVPKNCLSVYKSATSWKKFATITENWKFGVNYVFTTQIQDNIDVTCKTTSYDEVSLGDGTTAGAIDRNTKGAIIIPEKISFESQKFKVTRLSAFAFFSCAELTSITLPSSLTIIGSSAFSFCSKLTEMKIPNGVTHIGDRAFSNCSSLTSVTIPSSIVLLGSSQFVEYNFQEDIFGNCTSLKKIIMEKPEPIAIGSGTFGLDLSQVWLYVPYGSYSRYKSANYWSLFNIVEMEAPLGGITFADENVKALCVANWDTNGDGELNETEAAAVTNLDQVFKGNTKITSFNELQYFTGLSAIGKDAFNGCTALKSIVIPTNVKSIGESAFSKCRCLSTVVIPNSVTSIAQRAFGLCDGLKDVSLPGSVTLMNGVFSGCENIEKISISDIASWCAKDKSDWLEGLEDSNGYKLYVNGVEVKELVIPSSVTSIGKESFIFCSGITSVVIPNGVTDIRSSAFYGCNALTSVTVGMQTPPAIDTWTFSNRTNTTLHVPAGCKAAYQAANYWKEFKIEEVDGTNTEVDVDVTDISKLDNAIYIEPFTARVGDNVNIEVKLKNADTATSYGFEIELPDGVTITLDSDGSFDEEITLSSRNSKHNVTTNKLSGNIYKIGVASLGSKSLTDNDGIVLIIKANVRDDMPEGVYPVMIKNPLIVYSNGSKPTVQETQTSITVTVENYQKGDVDGDGVVDLADAVLVINHYVGKPVTTFIEKAADVDGDGVVDLADAVLIINYYVGKIPNLSRSVNENGLDPQ